MSHFIIANKNLQSKLKKGMLEHIIIFTSVICIELKQKPLKENKVQSKIINEIISV